MESFFAGTRPGTRVTCGSATFDLPILYFRDDVCALFMTADYAAVRRLMPSDRLHPATLPGGRALVGIMCFNYLDTTIGPYGEVGVIVPSVLRDGPPPPLWPVLRESRYPGFGSVVLHLPVTHRTARDAGRGQWGYPKFISDMHFRLTPEYMECRLSEGPKHILTAHVARQGIIVSDNKPLITYTVLSGKLIETTVRQKGAFRAALRPSGSFLELGDHAVADSIRELGVGTAPLLTRYYVDRAAILPAGRVVEESARPLEGYYGTDRVGECRVSYLED